MLRNILDQICQSLLVLFQTLNDKIAALNIELEEVKSVRDRFETDVGQTIQQLTDAKTYFGLDLSIIIISLAVSE